MAIQNAYLQGVYEGLAKRNPEQKEFLQAVEEVLESLEPVVEAHPEYEKAGLIERMVEPERVILFRVPWVDDAGKVQVNRGYRVQFNSAIGPYKGGLRFHPSVNLSILKFLGFEQCFKNSLTGLPMGGGKGGADFDPHGKSDAEVMRFCQSFMTELYHIGPGCRCARRDIGVGSRRRSAICSASTSACRIVHRRPDRQGIPFGGSLAPYRGYRLRPVLLHCQEMLADAGKSLRASAFMISGSGNVAHLRQQKAAAGRQGHRHVRLSGYIVDGNGIDYKVIKEIKEVKRARIKTYLEYVPHRQVCRGQSGHLGNPPATSPCPPPRTSCVWTVQGSGCQWLLLRSRGANMPSTPRPSLTCSRTASCLPRLRHPTPAVLPPPARMSQNSLRLSWSLRGRSMSACTTSWSASTGCRHRPPRSTARRATLLPVPASPALEKIASRHDESGHCLIQAQTAPGNGQ